jgi:predicted nuclease of predicted toxin-antitoxin system
LLLGDCIPARIAELMRAAGHDCVHVHDLGVNGHRDEQIMTVADAASRIWFTHVLEIV